MASGKNNGQGIIRVENFIHGEFEDCSDRLDSFDPSTGSVWASVPDSSPEIVDRAVYAALSAYRNWADMGYVKRAQYLKKVADLLEERLDEFAEAESRDQGKPVHLAKAMDIPRAVLNLRAFAESWTHQVETANAMQEAGVINYSTRSPLGVACLIAPWNLPLYLLTFKVAPALMAGNTVVAKPSEMTSVTAWMLAKLFQEAELPVGVFNLVCGTGPKAGEALVKHRDTRIISFTGSTAVGQRIAGLAAPMMKKLSLELGGKNAAIVFQDAEVEKVVQTLVRSAFLNQGEICLCTSRVFVHESIFSELVSALVDSTKRLSVGDPADPNTFMGPLISRQHLEKVLGYIGIARDEDRGQIWCGETVDNTKRKYSGGYFCQPTVITGLPDESRCMQEEIFGPVVCLTPFAGEDEVVQRANNVKYGLCASVWTKDVGRLHRVCSALDVGTVWANCWLVRSLEMPFGGCKMSGQGREGITHSLEAYTEEKTVCVKIK